MMWVLSAVRSTNVRANLIVILTCPGVDIMKEWDVTYLADTTGTMRARIVKVGQRTYTD